MAKKGPKKKVDLDTPVPVVGLREPCPCGSGKRYKQCHGRAARAAAEVLPPTRPFEGLAGECDWVALREFVPAATAPLKTAADSGSRDLTLCTLLPLALPAQVRADGSIWLATQTQDPGCGDPSRDLAAALLAALETEPGQDVEVPAATLDGKRLQDVLDVGVAPEITVRPDVGYWAEDESEELPPEVSSSIERVNAAISPTARLASVEAAYWVRSTPERTHLRWVMTYDENRLLDALARLHAAGESALIEGGRLIGSFRAYGLMVPVWEFSSETGAEALEDPAKAFQEKLAEAVEATTPLTSQERGARNGLVSRQITLR